MRRCGSEAKGKCVKVRRCGGAKERSSGIVRNEKEERATPSGKRNGAKKEHELDRERAPKKATNGQRILSKSDVVGNFERNGELHEERGHLGNFGRNGDILGE